MREDVTVDGPAKSEAPPASSLTRSHHGRVLAGVCAGLARRSDVDPVVYRVGFGMLGFLAVGLVLYLAAWLLLPYEETEPAPLGRLVDRRIDGPAALAIVTGLIALLTVAGSLFAMGDFRSPGIAVVVILGVAGVVAHHRGVTVSDVVTFLRDAPRGLLTPKATSAATAGRTTDGTPPHAPSGPHPSDIPHHAAPSPRTGDPWTYLPTPPREVRDDGSHEAGDALKTSTTTMSTGQPRRWRRWQGLLTAVTLGIALLVVGGIYLADAVGVVNGDAGQRSTAQLSLAAATVVIGAGLLVGTVRGYGAPLVIAGILVAIPLTLLPPPPPPGGARVETTGDATSITFGEATWTPQGKVADAYKLTFGEARLDLTHLHPRGHYQFTATVVAGELRVRAPERATVIVHARTSFGSIAVGDDQIASGYDRTATRRLSGSDDDRFVIELHLATRFGEVRVTRAPS